MRHVQGTFFTLKLDTFGSHWTLRQFVFGNIGYTLEVIMAGIAKMGSAETEKHCHTATVSALVLQVVGPVFGTHLGTGHITASSTN